MEATVTIDNVYGPNDNGWYDIKVGDTRYSTKKQALVDKANQLVGQAAAIEFTTTQNGKYTNHRLDGIQSANGAAPQAAPAPQSTPTPATTTPTTNRDASIVRQVCIKSAAQITAALVAHSENKKIQPVEAARVATSIASYLEAYHDNTGRGDDEDVPF